MKNYARILGITAVGLLVSLSPAIAQVDLKESGLVGKLEGATILPDAARPIKLHEAPTLAELVKTGKLPPVEQRVPLDALVIKPVHEIGRYGGTLRRAFNGPADAENGNRFVSADQLMHWNTEGNKSMPSVAKDVTISADGKVTTVHLRRGMKWSDGAPFNADDFVFYSENIDQNKDVSTVRNPELSLNGKFAKLKKLDDYTITFEFEEPNFLFQQIASSMTNFGAGQSYSQYRGRTAGAYAPAHYLKQYMPKYVGEEKAKQLATAAGYDNWVKYLAFKMDWTLNTELPTLGPWSTKSPINSKNWVLERNPYYWAVDTEGNQLPYLDRISMELVENLEVINLRAIAGEYDYQERFIDIAKLPLFIEGQEKGKYKVRLDLNEQGADSALYINQTFADDPEIAKWLQNRDFRRALSMGIDRNQLNETFWLGLGTPGSAIPASTNPYYPGDEWRNKWSTYEPDKANAMLDAIGLSKKDSEGFRLRTDNGQRLRFEIQVIASILPYDKHAEMITAQWRKVGIAADPKLVERNLGYTKLRSSKEQMSMWSGNGAEQVFLKSMMVVPTDPELSMMGNFNALWYVSNGKEGVKPTNAAMLKTMDIMRSAPGLPPEKLKEAGKEIWRLVIDEQYAVGLVGQSPASLGTRVVSNRMGNVPERTCIALHCRSPAGAHPETWYIKQ